MRVHKFALVRLKWGERLLVKQLKALVIGLRILQKEVVLTVKSLGFGPGMKGASISGWEASVTLDRRDFDISADQGLIGNSVDVLINVEADLK